MVGRHLKFSTSTKLLGMFLTICINGPILIILVVYPKSIPGLTTNAMYMTM
jgi:hypothetical protein